MSQGYISKLPWTFYFWFLVGFEQFRNSSGQMHLNLTSSVTDTLDELLKNYQRFLRPQHGGPPTNIGANLFIRSMGHISDRHMVYSMDAYFRQTWVDERLKFTGPIHVLALNINLLSNIWKPDTFFKNGLDSSVHMITEPNKLVRIYQNGKVLYSMRVTIKASCPMDLQSFPLDEQFCPLHLGSYAYTDKDVIYEWKSGGFGGVSTDKGLKLSQFDLQGVDATVISEKRLTGNFSVLSVRFHLQRQLGYFIIQIYVPCSLVVVLSWVSFWLHREATADRVGLGVTAFLTLTTISLEGKGSLPASKYGTYLDWFFIKCFAFVIGSILEFAGVHYFTKFNYGDQPTSDTEDDEEEENSKSSEYLTSRRILDPRLGHVFDDNTLYGSFRTHEREDEMRYKRDPCPFQFLMCLQSNVNYKKSMIVRGQKRNRGDINSVSVIDSASRIIFPVSFTVLSLIYWVRLYY